MITLCDTGPIIAYLNRNDGFHAWAKLVMQQVAPPLYTCEAVLTEAAYFLREDGLSVEPLFMMIERQVLVPTFDVQEHWPRLRTLMGRYEQMDFADACMVAMSELHKKCQVITVDRRDFTVYRRNDRQVIELIAPPEP